MAGLESFFGDLRIFTGAKKLPVFLHLPHILKRRLALGLLDECGPQMTQDGDADGRDKRRCCFPRSLAVAGMSRGRGCFF
jgi:hypothetical protein